MSQTSAVENATLANPKDDLRELLKVKKGSRFIPVMLLVVSAFAFMVHGLSSVGSHVALTEVFAKACTSVRTAVTTLEAVEAGTATDAQKAAAEAAGKQLQDRKLSALGTECRDPKGRSVDALVVEFRDKTNIVTNNAILGFSMEEMGGWFGVIAVISAGIKGYLDILWAAMLLYWSSAVATVGSAAAFALLPGLAGLFYRRDFWTWFGFGFVALLGITITASSFNSMIAGLDEATKTQGSAALSNPALDPAVVDLAASITGVLLFQLIVLVLAYRTRRHTTKPGFVASLMPANRYNQLLYWALALVAFDLVFNLFGSGAVWSGLWAALPFDDSLEWWNMLLFGLPFLYAVLKVTETWSGTRRKNIVVLLDGTSNTPDQVEMGFLAQTNVFKLFRMLKADAPGVFAPEGRFDATLCKTYSDRQIAFYYTGIGNKYDNDPLIGTLSQATGMGASGIIDRAYLDLIRVWRPGDRVFIFGFSRGAASARILARMIDERGAPNSIWTLRLFGRHWTLLPSKERKSVAVDVLGCWDTVGSFGIGKTIAGINFQQLNILHDMSVPDSVARAYHMVALDEERQEFEPTLMEPDPIRPERIVEVWFPGTHAGVGGGWATDRLSDVPLDFMLKEISSGYSADGKTAPGDESWGLFLSARNALAQGAADASAAPAAADQTAAPTAQPASSAFAIYPDPRGQLRVWMSKIYTYRPRKLPLHAVLSETVFERMKTSEPVYAPQALFDLNDALDDKRDLICAKVGKLDETKSIDPDERSAILRYTDKLRLTRWPQYRTAIEAARGSQVPALTLSNA